MARCCRINRLSQQPFPSDDEDNQRSQSHSRHIPHHRVVLHLLRPHSNQSELRTPSDPFMHLCRLPRARLPLCSRPRPIRTTSYGLHRILTRADSKAQGVADSMHWLYGNRTSRSSRRIACLLKQICAQDGRRSGCLK